MKKLFLSLVAMIIAAVSYAQNQNELVATVQRGDNVYMHYGANALVSAVNSAADNDIIVLSAGKFNGVEIKKSITIRGAGIDKTTIAGQSNIEYTYNGEYTMPDISIECLTIEEFGRYYNYSHHYRCGNLALNKVKVGKFGLLPWRPSCAVWFKNCIVEEFVRRWDSFEADENNRGLYYFINSKLNGILALTDMVMNNCIINLSNVSNIANCRIINSIIWNNSGNSIDGKLPSSTIISNTLAAGNYAEIFDDIDPEQNCQVVGMDVFGEANPENDLTEEAKSTYLGTDGTPVGVFGGQLPFNTNNPYPYISKMNVAAVTTADGKLSVEVEVSTAE